MALESLEVHPRLAGRGRWNFGPVQADRMQKVVSLFQTNTFYVNTSEQMHSPERQAGAPVQPSVAFFGAGKGEFSFPNEMPFIHKF